MIIIYHNDILYTCLKHDVSHTDCMFMCTRELTEFARRTP